MRMGRPKRADHGGLVSRVLNRANARLRTFENGTDRAATDGLLRVVTESLAYRGVVRGKMGTDAHVDMRHLRLISR